METIIIGHATICYFKYLLISNICNKMDFISVSLFCFICSKILYLNYGCLLFQYSFIKYVSFFLMVFFQSDTFRMITEILYNLSQYHHFCIIKLQIVLMYIKSMSNSSLFATKLSFRHVYVVCLKVICIITS